MHIKNLHEGIQDIRSKDTSNDLVFVYVLSELVNEWYPTSEQLLAHYGLTDSTSTFLYYTPPLESEKKVCYRIEKKPKIEFPDKKHIIIDKYFNTGKTLKSSIDMLSEQNVSENNIWFLSHGFSGLDIQIRLDLATKYLDYRKKYNGSKYSIDTLKNRT